MSVILKTREDIRAMTGGLLFHLDRYRDVLAESEAFCHVRDRVGEGENFEELFICWLMFRMWVANKVAWVIQYGGHVDLREDLPDVPPRRVDLRELAAELRNLDYNIYTNGGQHWLDHEWHQLFKQIAARVNIESEMACMEVAR
jgi:hypothetical protein